MKRIVKKSTKKVVKAEVPKIGWPIDRLRTWLLKKLPVKGDFINYDRISSQEQLEDLQSSFSFVRDEFPYCCAFAVVGDFNDDDFIITKDLPVTVQRACFMYALKYACDETAIFVTTIAIQSNLIAMLWACGFKPLSVTTNKNTGNKVTLWQAILKP